MTQTGFRYVYGPVPSRRLGRSLGVDLVPFKTCTYDCIYCQLGRTTNKTTERKEYVPTADILAELEQALADRPSPDYVSLAGSGEPTLHARIGEVIRKIKRLTSIPLAVLTNGSLLGLREVQDALMEADLILPSLDVGEQRLFSCVNRPHPDIEFGTMIDGLCEFRERFRKPLWLEVFLLAGVTGIISEVKKIAALAKRIRPERVQLNTVSRPPAEEFAYSVPGSDMEEFADLFDGGAEVITEEGFGGPGPLALTAVIDKDILALLSRRPSTARGVSAGLGVHVGEATKRLQALVERGVVSPVKKDGASFYEIKRTT
jgi:wyosine [tRNA(Phe)-imidazoG37] synthetase (radical SAM superfamily)